MPGKKAKFWQSSIARAGLAALSAILIVGLLAYGVRTRRVPVMPESRPSDPQQIACAEAQQTVKKNLPVPSSAKFSDYVTDQGTGAAEIGRGIWEAWGKVDYQNAAGDPIHAKWHVAWVRKTNRIIYRKIGEAETGNYVDALQASGAYPTGPAAGD